MRDIDSERLLVRREVDATELAADGVGDTRTEVAGEEAVSREPEEREASLLRT